MGEKVGKKGGKGRQIPKKEKKQKEPGRNSAFHQYDSNGPQFAPLLDPDSRPDGRPNGRPDGYYSSNSISNDFLGKKVGEKEGKWGEKSEKGKKQKRIRPKFGFSPVRFK